jgi:hypothetical protein
MTDATIIIALFSFSVSSRHRHPRLDATFPLAELCSIRGLIGLRVWTTLVQCWSKSITSQGRTRTSCPPAVTHKSKFNLHALPLPEVQMQKAHGTSIDARKKKNRSAVPDVRMVQLYIITSLYEHA